MTTDSHLRTDNPGLATHLKELTNALNALHGDLYWLAMQAPDAKEKQAVPAAELDVDILSQLKSAIDDMRLLLWQYIEAASEVNPQSVREGMETQRLHRMTKFLQVLRDRLGHSDDQPVSFIERISASVKKRLGDRAA